MTFDLLLTARPRYPVDPIRQGARSLFVDLLLLALVLFVGSGCDSGTSKAPESGAEKKTARPPDKSKSVGKTSAEPAPSTAMVDQPPVLIAEPPPKTVYRPDDTRARHDDAAVQALGIHILSSRRLKLYSDVDPAQIRSLPGMVDQLYEALAAEFGPIPPDRAGTDYQMTGYLIRDNALFREAGLIPDDLPLMLHGRHRGQEFWLREQEYDYYRAHLLLHEATHCFMTVLPESEVKVWYMEGMAELFATHQVARGGEVTFGIMPASAESVAGWGRITLIREAFAAGRGRSIPQVFDLTPDEFLHPEPYAWSWALCKFLQTHPRYRDEFQRIAREARNRDFLPAFQAFWAKYSRPLSVEWMLFQVNLEYGYDIPCAAIDFEEGEPLTSGQAAELDLQADQGWQSSRVLLNAGQRYRVRAAGRVTLGQTPKPWVSEADGISFDYVDGLPVGRVLATVLASDPDHPETMLRVLPVGHERDFEAPTDGTLYLRVNDRWSSLAENAGSYQVTVEALPVTSQ